MTFDKDKYFAPLAPFEAECREKFGDGNFCYISERFPEHFPMTYRINLKSRGGEKIEIGTIVDEAGRPVLAGGLTGINGPELAEWLNRERLGLSPDDTARICVGG